MGNLTPAQAKAFQLVKDGHVSVRHHSHKALAALRRSGLVDVRNDFYVIADKLAVRCEYCGRYHGAHCDLKCAYVDSID